MLATIIFNSLVTFIKRVTAAAAVAIQWQLFADNEDLRCNVNDVASRGVSML